ncbi:MAG TPA: hypothetical protein VMJ35_03095 [Dongiaceae bacterium]|nr:hypothetical protein [Dongiaceae bacterium]
MKLQRALVKAAQEEFEFFYDFPSRSMLAIYERLAILQSGQIVRWAKLLRSEQKLTAMVRNRRLARVAATVVDPFLGRKPRTGPYDIEVHEGACEEEFTRFDQQLPKTSGIRTVRNADYLNWRYLQAPDEAFRVLTARQKGQLKGYAVCAVGSDHGAITDLCAADDPTVVRSLLDASIAHLRTEGASVVVLNAVSSHPWSEEFRRVGFSQRDASPFIAFVKPGAGIPADTFLTRWYGMRGERDS